MDIFRLSKSQHICYNSSVPQKRDESIFDIGGRQTAPAVGPKPGSCVPHDCIGRAACPHAAASTAEGHTQQRIEASGKPLLFTDEAKIRCCAVWQSRGATSFFCFIQARSGASRKQGFEGAPLSFRAEAAALNRAGVDGVDFERRMKQWRCLSSSVRSADRW